MKNILVATTALASVLATNVYAMDNTAKTKEMDKGTKMEMSEPMAGTAMQFSIFSKDVSKDATKSQNGYLAATPGQILASGLMGKTVYSTMKNESGEHLVIGDVNDIVLDGDGTVDAAVVGVGGFIGLGEKDVAVNFDRLQWMSWDGERRLVMASTKEELESAPEFNRDGVEKMTNANLLVIDQNKLSAEQLIGTAVYGEKLNEIGEVGDVILDSDEQVDAYIVDVGGFLGINTKPIELEADKLNVYADAKGILHVYTPFTQEQLENMPSYEETDQISLLK
ncbi:MULTISPECIES: PRC-barrel domain-containing protein [Cohaesibacter]|uniref:PRC-barrel domain-containing protein n=1 Tax=Cohaesibacter TaxID=655352 RepID=UPI001485A958|nr:MULTISPECIES: PRC-barrel domain-containing protein [Cohaesibacter]